MNAQALFALMRKDAQLYAADRFFALVTVLALVAYVALFYLLPATQNDALTLGIYLDEVPPALEELFTSDEVLFIRAESVAELQQAVTDGSIPAGYAFPPDALAQLRSGASVEVQLFLSPDVPPEFRELYAVVLREIGFALRGQTVAIETTEIVLGRDLAGTPIPLRERMLPLLAVFVLMVECLGLASLIANEVETKTIRALLITPLSLPGLFLAKGLFGTLFAFSQASLLMLLTGGLAQQPLLILAALLFGSALVTGVAFMIASVGRDLMSVMGWGMLGLLLLAVPTFSLLIPGLSNAWIRLIPSYYLVDTVYQVINLGAGWSDVSGNLLILLAYALAFMALGVLVLRRKLA